MFTVRLPPATAESLQRPAPTDDVATGSRVG
jgi:hypothetical protein